MEDLSPVIDSNSDEGIRTEARSLNSTRGLLSLDDHTVNQAMELIRKTKHVFFSNIEAAKIKEYAERCWFVFIAYVVKKLSGRSEDKDSIKLGRLLKVTEINAMDFLNELQGFVTKTGPILSCLYGADWEKRLETKELFDNFKQINDLSKFYRLVFGEFFLTSDANLRTQSRSTDGHLSKYFRFGWLLFLVLRVHKQADMNDLLTCTNRLIAILAVLIIHIPCHFRTFSLDSSGFVRKSNKGINLLASLVNYYHTSEDDIRKSVQKVNSLIADSLKVKQCQSSDCKKAILENIDTDDLVYFEDLLEEPLLSSRLGILNKNYDDAIHINGDLDERAFVNELNNLLGADDASGDLMMKRGVKRKLDMVSSPERTITSSVSTSQSPVVFGNATVGGLSPKMAATPVNTALIAANWLQTFILPLPSKPSTKLDLFLSSCSPDLTSDVMQRADIILKAIFPGNALGGRCVAGGLQNTTLIENVWANERQVEAVKLYYKVLEAVCTVEAQSLHGRNISSLLTNEMFHRCMLACSAELVLATHRTITMLFPAALEKTGITAFDLCKVIECFIRHEQSLPRELQRHLNSLEEHLLESIVWEKGSSMYNSLTVARPSLSSEISRLGLLAEPMPSLDSIVIQNRISCAELPLFQKDANLSGHSDDKKSPMQIYTDPRSVLVDRHSFTSPVKDQSLAFNHFKSKLSRCPLQTSFATPTRRVAGGGGETCAENAISFFFSKTAKLAAVRINGMIGRLKLSQQVRERVYYLFQQILSQRTSLFFNRHIDQIILCCFYGVAKISGMNLTFKEIVRNYRKQPHCKAQVFCAVYADFPSPYRNGRTGPRLVDIKDFYNMIFVPAVKPLLQKLVSGGRPQRDNDAQQANMPDNAESPESPKLTQFPSLPDMSPKKVSAFHNIYVSPLRPSKRDALFSHSPKSYYACIGESTRPYQSPSKDLSSINNCLNSMRRPRGALKLDDADIVDLFR